MNGSTLWRLTRVAIFGVALAAMSQAAEPMTAASVTRVIAARAVPSGSSPTDHDALQRVVTHLRAGEVQAAGHAWKKLCARVVAAGRPFALDPMLYWVAREAYLTPDPVLAQAGELAWFRSEQAGAADRMLASLGAARDQLRRAANPAATTKVPSLELTTVFRPGAAPVVARGDKNLSLMLIQAEILLWEQKKIRTIELQRTALADFRRALQARPQAAQAMAAAITSLGERAREAMLAER